VKFTPGVVLTPVAGSCIECPAVRDEGSTELIPDVVGDFKGVVGICIQLHTGLVDNGITTTTGTDSSSYFEVISGKARR